MNSRVKNQLFVPCAVRLETSVCLTLLLCEETVVSRFEELCHSGHCLLLLLPRPSRTAGSKLPVSKNCSAS